MFSLQSILQKGILSFAVLISFISPTIAEALEITSFGHSALLIKGGGHAVLLNPFKAVGCAAGLIEPNVNPDIILASSELVDEGSWNKQGVFFVKPGSYRINGLRLEGFSASHDRVGGRRLGYGTFWQWMQGGLNFVHLGGIAGPLNDQDKLFLGRPDVLVIGVGGGSKVYNGKEAAQLVNELNPKIVIPVQYVRGTAPNSCDQTGIQPFLDATQGIESRQVGSTYTIPNTLPETTTINLMP
ncbi:Inactivated Zn-dependent hydrolase of the beta-lactamase fold [Prochlorococcus sp. SS52]|nr:Inactivated Zn-dependent hydrolase of the beta-lactamase fold [Prochlorococcus marinus str. LG]KGG37098.1 Inactivated Zn-dependent hydrolase of the beta-lactamase fold [Prochlorococcus sp. SS52]